ncbi:MAG: hypothetical protein SVX43_10475 [Cyanobacteriota bacterium]|nr:hypothetical protein [Cyanobacteriota bacterium]
MNNCPCCSSQMLRHIRPQNLYWYCPRCRQEMPNFEDWVQRRIFRNAFAKTRFRSSATESLK